MPVNLEEAYVTSLTVRSTACVWEGISAKDTARVGFPPLDIKSAMTSEGMLAKRGGQVNTVWGQYIISW